MSNTPKVLVVDDDPALRPLITVICKRLGFDCDGAADGVTALEKIRSESYDVMLLDLMMPRMSGFEVIEALRSIPNRPTIVVLTAQGATQTEGLEDGDLVYKVIHKPFDIDELTGLLAELATVARESKDPAL